MERPNLIFVTLVNKKCSSVMSKDARDPSLVPAIIKELLMDRHVIIGRRSISSALPVSVTPFWARRGSASGGCLQWLCALSDHPKLGVLRKEQHRLGRGQIGGGISLPR
jgi:hypothetical protein